MEAHLDLLILMRLGLGLNHFLHSQRTMAVSRNHHSRISFFWLHPLQLKMKNQVPVGRWRKKMLALKQCAAALFDAAHFGHYQKSCCEHRYDAISKTDK